MDDVWLVIRRKVLDIHNLTTQALLLVDPAATVDGGLLPVQAIYQLEGGRPTVLHVLA